MTVIVQGIAIETAVKVGEDDIVTRHRHLVCTVVVENVGCQGERVGLVHLHMTEGIEGVISFVVAGAVTGEDDIVVTKTHISTKNLCVWVQTLVIEQFVGVKEDDT